MIGKQDILDRVRGWGLRPEVVEKDYVLGWLLAGFAAHPLASTTWAFKGGTCLKKCFFETYRFSEDLDFSLLPGAPYEEESISALLREVTTTVSEMSGITFPAEKIEVRQGKDKRGRPTYEGRVAYRGPLAVPTWPRVLLDITQHELVVGPPVRQAVFHPYPDQLPDQTRVLSYSLEELFAEKTRALYERARPRDLYDVIHLWERRAAVSLDSVREMFTKKCAAKEIARPTASSLSALVRAAEELRAAWTHMLGHQLPALPDLDGLLARLDEVLAWIDAPPPEPAPLPVVATKAGETIFAPRGGHYWGGAQPLELIRFAGANRLKVAFVYNGKPRIVEPYSFRVKGTGNLLLYAWENGAWHIKAFNTDEMYDVKATNEPFVPRYAVELTG